VRGRGEKLVGKAVDELVGVLDAFDGEEAEGGVAFNVIVRDWRW